MLIERFVADFGVERTVVDLTVEMSASLRVTERLARTSCGGGDVRACVGVGPIVA